MARRPEPWWWKERQAWFVTIDGVRHSLGPDEDDARQRFHELMAEPRKRRVSSGAFRTLRLARDRVGIGHGFWQQGDGFGIFGEVGQWNAV